MGKKYKNINVLCVDDDPDCLTVISELLEENFMVFKANNAKEALEIQATEKINIFFVDLSMPSMNGIDLCRQIRERDCLAQLCAVTGLAKIFQFQSCREVGFDDYILKPLDIAEFLEVSEVMAKKYLRWIQSFGKPSTEN